MRAAVRARADRTTAAGDGIDAPASSRRLARVAIIAGGPRPRLSSIVTFLETIVPRILCIDGGGIRGIVPAVVLDALEQRTGRAISDCFDLIAGTSTGGIIALALTRPDPRGRPQYTAADVVGFYEDIGPSIFARDPLHRARTLESLGGPRFDAAALRRAMLEYFGDTRLSDALRDDLVPAYDIERREPFFFKSHYARTRPERDFRMRDVALATAAGPTYFEPVRIETKDHVGYRALVDGGVFANNPTMCAWVEALGLFGGGSPVSPVAIPVRASRANADAGPAARGRPNPATRPLGEHIEATLDVARSGPPRVAGPRYTPVVASWDADWLVLSLGTGRNERRIPYAKARGWGLASWATTILDIVFDGVSDTVDHQMRQLLPELPDAPIRYCRIQTELKDAAPELGDARKVNIARLKRLGHDVVRANAQHLEAVARRLD